MAHHIRAIKVAAVGSTGQVIQPGITRLHGWVLTESSANAGILQFRSNAPNPQSTSDGPATVSSPILFERTMLASADVPAFLDHLGFELPGGLAITCSGSAQVTGVVLIS